MDFFYIFLLSFVLFLALATFTIQDTITIDTAILDGDTLVSANEMDTPITDSSGAFRVDTNGSLLVIAGSNNTFVVWSSNISLVSPTTINPVAQLLNTGNLIVRGQGEESFVWQSFDYPTDTFLSGMKFGKDIATGIDRRLTSWKSADDPSPGQYIGFMDTDGFPQLFTENGSVMLSRLGPWNGVTFNGLPNHVSNSTYNPEFVFNDKEVYYQGDRSRNGSDIGSADTASVTNLHYVGPYGASYANIEITRGGSGCFMWSGDLMDVRRVDESQDLYVRVAISDLAKTVFVESTSKSSSIKRRQIIIAAASVLSSLVIGILLLAIMYAWSKKKRSPVETPDEPVQTIDKEPTMEIHHDDTELSYFSLTEISKSTNDFSDDNKLGEGGFGPVYMGVLDDGREIAVKRLSKTSRQGLNEFKNELKF
ncbi:G-type lectin S-receptor-like serine/threonine-protein kinase [Tanacetum coccineum]